MKMSEESLQETIADEAGFKGETDESELQALVSKLKTNILIVGSGGAGNNTLTRLYKEGLTTIELLAVNTDAQHLLNTPIPNTLKIIVLAIFMGFTSYYSYNGHVLAPARTQAPVPYI